MIEAIRETLGEEMLRDERMILLGQDIGASGGVFRATEGLQEQFGESRVVDMPLAEGVIIGSAIGLAASGLVPVAELQFLGFGSQAFHQLEGQLARMRYRSRGRFPMPVVVRAPYGGNVRTPELHSDAHEAKYANVPGLKILAPATAADAKGLLASAIRDPDPVLFCEPLRGYRLIRGPVPDGEHLEPLGVARVARSGEDVALIAWSAAVVVAEAAADAAEKEGISCFVLDLRSLSPLDDDAIREAAAGCGRVVVVHEGSLTAGFGAEVVATVVEEAFWSIEAPIERVSAYDTPYPIAALEERYNPDAERVLASIRAVAEA